MALDPEQRYYLKLKAAYYYYERDMQQNKIADILGVSRLTLGKLLKEARQEGLVRIEIVDQKNLRRCLEAEEVLRARYHLSDIKVTDTPPDADADTVNRNIASAAARYVEQKLHSNMRVGLAWGRTLEWMAHSIRSSGAVKNLEVVTLLGGAGTMSSMVQPNVLAQVLLEKFGGSGYIINAPYICQSESLCASIKAEPGVSEALAKGRESDITLVGLGEQPAFTERYNSYHHFDRETIDMLLSAGAVGDICSRFFDVNGRPCDTSVCRRIIGVELNALKSYKNVVVIGGGPTKCLATLGALRGGYADVLITDYETARAVIAAG